LAARVRWLLPLNHHPEKFHEDKDEIVHALLALADGVVPAAKQPPNHRREKQQGEGERRITAVEVINGKRVIVQKRRSPFAICSE
jgi:hypothetical protein